MPNLRAGRWVGALGLAAVTGLGFSVLSAQPGQADPAAAVQVAPGRVAVVDLRAAPGDAAAPAPTGLDDAVALSTYPTVADGVRGANLALRADGTVVGWGADLAGETRPPADLTEVVDLDLGGGFALAARADGSVAAWGGGEPGALDVPGDLGSVRAVAALGRGTCGYGIALRSDGTLVQWGGGSCDDATAYQLPDGLSDVTAVSAGEDAAIALRSDGTVVTWGPSGDLGYLDGVRPSTWTGITQVSTQSRTFVGLTADHQTVAYGIWGEAGAPVGLTDVVSVSAGTPAAFLRADGSASLWPGSSPALEAGRYSAVESGLGYVVTISPARVGATPTAGPTQDPEPTTEPTGTTGTPLPTGTPEPSEPGDPTDAPPPTEPEAPGPALGADAVQPSTDASVPGTAVAFRFTATRDLRAKRFHLFLDESSTARTVSVGVYADADGTPGRLLAVGRLRHATAGTWNVTRVQRVRVQAGQRYWLAVQGERQTGSVVVRARAAGEGEGAGSSAQATRTRRDRLPKKWLTGGTSTESPASMYVS